MVASICQFLSACPQADSLRERSILLAIPPCLTGRDEDDIIRSFDKVLSAPLSKCSRQNSKAAVVPFRDPAICHLFRRRTLQDFNVAVTVVQLQLAFPAADLPGQGLAAELSDDRDRQLAGHAAE